MSPEQRTSLAAVVRAEIERRNTGKLWVPFPDTDRPHPQRMALESKADILFFGGAAGGGKMLSLATPIPTPTGWSTMGALVPGAEIFDERGEICRVTVVHPIDEMPISYRVTFDDGTSIDACADHPWITYDAAELAALTKKDDEWRARRRANRPSRAGTTKSDRFRLSLSARNSARAASQRTPLPEGSVRTTAAIANSLRLPSGRSNHAISMALPLRLPPKNLMVDPYVLGAWLGDGTSKNASITCYDLEILEHISAAGYRISSHRKFGHFGICGTLHGDLRRLGLKNNKHIPEAYLRASIDQRIALLQGLMDTDGNCTERGQCEFTTTSAALRDGMAELLASLGIKAPGSEGRATLNGKDCGPKYRFKFLASFPVFRLIRKAERQKPPIRRTTKFRYIVACDRIAPVPMRCITVDSPSALYLAGRQMVPTHNSSALVGIAAIEHHTSIIFRRQATQLDGIRQEAERMLAGHAKFNQRFERWRFPNNRLLFFGAMDKEEDWKKHQGKARDYMGFDELTHFTESQFRNVIGWNRPAVSSLEGMQRSRIIAAGNPPTDAIGYWVIDFWGPWLDDKHPRPAAEGELRWYVTLDGKDIEVPDGTPIEHRDARTLKIELIQPRSRTFIRSLITDNPILMANGYMATLQGMQEPMRSQMLYGDFRIGQNDHEKQIIPSAWVQAAMKRWEEQALERGNDRPPVDDEGRPVPMDALGVDVARGGKDRTVLSPQYGTWFARQRVYPGTSTPDGPAVVALIAQVIPSGSNPDVKVDVIGVGSSPLDFSKAAGLKIHAMNGKNTSYARSKGGNLRFANMRIQWYWQLKEALDPSVPEEEALALPPDRELLADLTAVRLKEGALGLQAESKEDVTARIGRSPDKGDSFVYAHGQPKKIGLALLPGSITSPPISIYAR